MNDEPKQPRAWVVIAFPLALLRASLLIDALLILGSFVTYTPAIDATTMQNIYIGRILHYGSAIGLLNLLAIASLVTSREVWRRQLTERPR